jgi:hypothetical protein
MLMKAFFDDAEVIGEAPCQNVIEDVVDDVEVDGESPCQNVSESSVVD